MIEINIPHKILQLAQKKADDLGALRNSIRSGAGNYVGFLGELVVCAYLGIHTQNTYDYDLVYKNVKFDVKTKECTSPPKPFYECSVAAYNTTQQCKAYVFTRICKDKAWILGWKGKEEYYSQASFLQKGDIDPSNNFTVKADCYNLKISNLRSLEKISVL